MDLHYPVPFCSRDTQFDTAGQGEGVHQPQQHRSWERRLENQAVKVRILLSLTSYVVLVNLFHSLSLGFLTYATGDRVSTTV